MIFDRLFRNSGGGADVLTTHQLAERLAMRNGTAAGINVTHDRALRLMAVLSCTRVLAESVGQLPLHVYRRNDREKKKATDHPLYGKLHRSPNDLQTSSEWLQWGVGCLANRGNWYTQIIRSGPRVVELFPLHPDRVRPKLSARSELTYEIAVGDGKTETLPARELLHNKILSFDGVMGLNPIAYARESIGGAIAMEQHGASLFKNGAAPGGTIEVPTEFSDVAYARLKDSWEARHQGSENAHRIAILEMGAKFNAVGITSQEAQWLEARKFNRSEICGLFRVPPHLIADLDRATFSNIEHMSLDFVVHGLMPYLVGIEQRAEMSLLQPQEQDEYTIKFNVAGLLRGDMAARSAFYNALVQMGALSPNEVREQEDLNPREGGDIWLTPSNMNINGKLPEPTKAAAAK